MALSEALHARNMLLMVDVAPNHMGSGPPGMIKYNDFVPWNDERYFHPPRFNIRYEPPNQTEIEQFWIGEEGGISLADLNTELPEVYHTLYLWIQRLVERYSIDGIRLDTVKHIRKSFWPKFCKYAGVFAIGEVFDGGFEYISQCIH
jgi:alpha-amylase